MSSQQCTSSTQFGCKIGKTALQQKRGLFQIQQQMVRAAKKKEEQAYIEKREGMMKK